MNKTIRLEAIAVVFAIVLFILVDIILIFGFIQAFDTQFDSIHAEDISSLNRALNTNVKRKAPSGRAGSLIIVHDQDVLRLQEQLRQVKTFLPSEEGETPPRA